MVDGRRFPTPRSEEFVRTLTDEARVVIELTGAEILAPLPRTFVLRLDDLEAPYLLFDERTRKQRRNDSALTPGGYFLLHRAADTLVDAEQSYPWSDSARVLSYFQVRPGAEATLEGEAGGRWTFAAALTPFFDAAGERLASENREPLYFGWRGLPLVWRPQSDQDPELPWRVQLRQGDTEHTWALVPTEEQAGGMMKCRVASGDFVAQLAPGMYHLELTLLRSEQSGVAARAEYWLWKGLTGYTTREFQLAAPPQNLLRAECRGFAFAEYALRHLADPYRRHTLTFAVDGVATEFHWAQPGIFLESVERSVGRPAEVRAHALEATFFANRDSLRWLRIWISGQLDWQIVIAGQSWLKRVAGDRREFVELSLASLATALPGGGDIYLKLGSEQKLLARFASPLQAVSVERNTDDTHQLFRFQFSEPIVWLRPVVKELASGEERFLEGQPISGEGSVIFATPEFPKLLAASAIDPNTLVSDPTYPLTLSVPKGGWPEGLWLIELETRHDAQADWERVLLNGKFYVPVVASNRTGTLSATTRARLLRYALAPQTTLADLPELDEEGRAELVELLAELIALRQRKIAPMLHGEMRWVESAVRVLSHLAGPIALRPEGLALQTELLNFACQDPRHAGFVHLPGLLALPARAYRELPSGDPLNDALRWCGKLAAVDTVTEAVRQDFTFWDPEVLYGFANFAKVVGAASEDAGAPEFSDFAHEPYWQKVLGPLDQYRLAADWPGDRAVLGRAHLVWALDALLRHYAQPAHELYLAAANALLHCAPKFRTWLHERLGDKNLMAPAAWKNPWPLFSAPEDDFLETTPRFSSLFALAARAAAAGLLSFQETLTWLAGRVGPQRAEQGIAALVGLAPELFGHQLLFWELVVRTAPQKTRKP